MNNKLVRVVHESNELSATIYSLSEHPFMKKITTLAQHKSGADRDFIIQTLMLICTNQENDFTSFRAKDIDDFVINYADENIDKLVTLEAALDKFNEAFDEIKIPVTTIPQVLYVGYKVVKDKKSFSKLVDIINEFLNGYDTNDEYKQYVQSGTSSQENVRARFEYWRNLIKTA